MHLEATRPEPTLFPGNSVAAYRFMHRYVQTIMFPTMAKIIIVDIPDNLSGADKDYFIESREARFGNRWRMSVPTATTPCKRSAFSLTRSARQWPAAVMSPGTHRQWQIICFSACYNGPGLLTF